MKKNKRNRNIVEYGDTPHSHYPIPDGNCKMNTFQEDSRYLKTKQIRLDETKDLSYV